MVELKSTTYETDISNFEIIYDIQRVKNKLDKVPSCREYDNHCVEESSESLARWRFGSWNNALKLCGLEPNQKSNFLPKECVVRLYFGDGMKQEKIADKFNCSCSTVFDRLNDIPTVRSPDARQIIYHEEIEKEKIGYIDSETRRLYGIIEEDDSYVFKSEFALNSSLREYFKDGRPEVLKSG